MWKVSALFKDGSTKEQIVQTESEAQALQSEWMNQGARSVEYIPVPKEPSLADRKQPAAQNAIENAPNQGK